MNYAAFLRARARHVPERASADHLASALEERNVECLLAWVSRWYARCARPDAWDGHSRRFFDLSLATKRQAAHEWLRSRRAERPTNVLTLRRSAS